MTATPFSKPINKPDPMRNTLVSHTKTNRF